MVTLVGIDPDLETLVEDLIVLEYDAIAAYEAALERLEDETSKTQLRAFVLDHGRHLKDLTGFARTAGIDAPLQTDAKVVLTKGKVVIGGLIGDRAILYAMKTNEDDTVTAYERAAEIEELPPALHAAVEEAAGDERRHRAWMELRMRQLDDHSSAA